MIIPDRSTTVTIIYLANSSAYFDGSGIDTTTKTFVRRYCNNNILLHINIYNNIIDNMLRNNLITILKNISSNHGFISTLHYITPIPVSGSHLDWGLGVRYMRFYHCWRHLVITVTKDYFRLTLGSKLVY